MAEAADTVKQRHRAAKRMRFMAPSYVGRWPTDKAKDRSAKAQ